MGTVLAVLLLPLEDPPKSPPKRPLPLLLLLVVGVVVIPGNCKLDQAMFILL
jgi:hypothetical protein